MLTIYPKCFKLLFLVYAFSRLSFRKFLGKTRITAIALCTASLSACMMNGTNSNNSNYYLPENPQTTPLYPEGYESVNTYVSPQPQPIPQADHEVQVPETYHISSTHSPTSAKEVDKTWVTTQNPHGYTIELAEGDKASSVARVLYQAPKNERTAEVKYQRFGKAYYKGLYGSYPNYEAAQQALNELPADVKQNAHIKNWSSVQSGLGE